MGPRFHVGDWLVEPDLNRIVRADRIVPIEPKVMDVLAFLASHPGEVCPRDTIMKAVWPGTYVSTDVLPYCISELRKAFGDSARDPSIIATITKRGYRLIAPVAIALASEDPPPLSPGAPGIPGQLESAVGDMQGSRPEDREQQMREAPSGDHEPQASGGEAPLRSSTSSWLGARKTKVIVGLISIAPLLILLVWHVFMSSSPEPTRMGSAPTVTPTPRSIAVIPFENLSPDPQNAFFTEGFTEDLINQLSKIRDLRVISRAAVARYGNDPAVPRIEKELGVEMIVTGSVKRDAGRLRVSTRLIDAKSGKQLWGETYDGALTGLFRIQSEVARTIAARLSIALSVTEQGRIQKEPTANPAAYDYYLKGREFYRRYRSRDNENAITLFEQALQTDPNLALAHAGLADCYAQKAYQFGYPAVWTDKAAEASRKALSLDSDLAEAHKALGFAHWNRGQFRQALNAYYRAVELNPSYSAPITNIAVTLEQQGKYFEALQWARRALSLNPTESIAYFNIGDVYRDLHDIDRAAEWYRKALSLNPDYEPAHVALGRLHIVRKNCAEALAESRKILALNTPSFRGLNLAGGAHLASGDLKSAGDCYRSALAVAPNLEAAIRLSLIQWKVGKKDEAERRFDSLTSSSQADIDRGTESWRPWWIIAVACAARGDVGKALSSLEKAAAAGWRPGPGVWGDPEYENLVAEGGFRTLMATLIDDIDQQRRRALLLDAFPK